MGPPFVGKELMARMFVATGLQDAEGALVVLTDTPLPRARVGLQELDDAYLAHEDLGLVHFVDMRSGTSLADPQDSLARYLGPPWSADSLCRAVEDGFRLAARDLPVQRFVMASLSTFYAFVGSTVTFTALMRLADAMRRGGAAGMILVDPAVHSAAELQVFKRQVDGVIEFRTHQNATEMRVMGLDLMRGSPWVRYELQSHELRITGSWSEGRIT